MKIAFITHTTSIGGAALSSSKTIQLLLDKGLLYPEECLLIHQRYRVPSNEKNDAYYSLKQKIRHYEWQLPWSHVDQISGPPSMIIKLYSFVKNLQVLFFFISIYPKILKKEKIQVVHLNSIVLWPILLVLPNNIQAIIHIREGFLNSIEAKIAQQIIRKKASAIISIDHFCAMPFLNNPKSIVILNPFNMSKARGMKQSKTEIKKKYGLSNDTFIVSVIGRIELNKGQHLISSIAKKINSDKIIFLVVGLPNGKFGKQCLEDIQQYSNVKCLGQINDMDQIYAITDIVLRLDLIDYFPLGRTVWEGIFSGCLAILPVKKGYDLSSIQNLLNKYIFVYDDLDMDNLAGVLHSLLEKYPNTSENDFPMSDNTEQSATEFFNVLQKCQKMSD